MVVSLLGGTYDSNFLCSAMYVVSCVCLVFCTNDLVGVWNHPSVLELYMVLQVDWVCVSGFEKAS